MLLIHSLHLGAKEFEAADIKSAANFRKAAQQAHIKRIIYLGGLGDVKGPLSSHLENRIKVAENLNFPSKLCAFSFDVIILSFFNFICSF